MINLSILDIFKKKVNKEEVKEKLDLNELNKTIDDVFGIINGLVIEKTKYSFESDVYKCKKEDFNIALDSLNEKGIDVEVVAGLHIISKTIKDNKSTIYTILRKFSYNEK